eukprot:gene45924-12917_t
MLRHTPGGHIGDCQPVSDCAPPSRPPFGDCDAPRRGERGENADQCAGLGRAGGCGADQSLRRYRLRRGGGRRLRLSGGELRPMADGHR